MFLQANERRAARGAVIALAAALVLTSCGAQDDEAASSGTAQSGSGASPDAADRLADTRWQLVEFQSMDDAIGTTRPEDPTVYVMELIGDGRVAMQLNCNRATGTWTARPSADGRSGSFEIGPLAMTRALCPQPSLDEQIARDADYVRSFVLNNGRLHLSLMADAGIYVWEPAP